MSTDRIAAVAAALRMVGTDGVAVGVVTGDTAVFGSVGSVDGELLSEQTVMYGASLAKQVVGLLLAQAVDTGRISAADRVITWLPELPDWMGEIRLHHLLHHTSGLPDVTAPAQGIPESNADVIARFRRFPTRTAVRPGLQFSYNNAGYVLLAEVVSHVSGRPIGQLASERLFRPLAMTRTRLGGEPPRLTDQPLPPGTIGDGGLWTSIADLTRWLAALNKGLHEVAAVHRAETPGCLDDGTPLDYAWGLRVTPSPHGRRITHGGSWAGWQAKTIRLPERQIAVAVLSTGGEEQLISTLGTDLADQFAGCQ
jgi:CubicO group peptidase (beta-lactamase class C family)